jgi:hypothetical protein
MPSRTTLHRRVRPLSTASLTESPLWWKWVLVSVLAALPALLLAQPLNARGDGFLFHRPSISLSVRSGYDRPLGQSDIYSFTTTQLTLNRNSFAAAGFQGDLAIRFADRWEAVLSAATARRNAGSEFRSFIDNDDKAIEQTTTLNRTSFSLGVRYALTEPGEKIGKFAWIPARFTPWVGAGAGVMPWQFKQKGDFVDFQTLKVFGREFNSEGQEPMYYANVGADYALNMRVALTGDLRYTNARGALGTAFEGFNRIDLSGTAATIGLTVRY